MLTEFIFSIYSMERCRFSRFDFFATHKQYFKKCKNYKLCNSNSIQLGMVRKTLKQVIKACDLFSHPAAFRYGQQPEYQSLTGGICSIILFCVFTAIFTNTVMSTINKTSIDSKVTTLQQQDPTYYQVGTDNFMFAIGITGHNLNVGDRWFNIYLQKVVIDSAGKQKTTMELQPCQKQQWTKIKPEIADAYDKIGLDAWLCPKEGTLIQLQGKYSSPVFKYYKFGVRECNGTINGRSCATNATLDTYLSANEAFTFNFYYMNTIINPSNNQYVSSYLDDLNYFPFTQTDGISANFFLSSFTINTDESIYPYETPNVKQGGISTGPAQTINYKVRQKDFLKFYLRKSSLSLVIQRSFRKLDDTFSYIGGLFSAIVTVLFIMTKYNEISYQMQIAKNLYHYDRNVPLKSDDFNIFVFFGYLIYAFFETICIKLPWKRMEVYFNSLQEVRKQMDIRLVMKKVLYSERMAIAVFDQHKAKILHLQEPLTLKQAEQIRKDHRFYDKLEKKYFDYKKIKQQQENQMRVNEEQVSFGQLKNKKEQISELKQFSSGQIIAQPHINSKSRVNKALTLNSLTKKQLLDSPPKRRRAKKNTKTMLKETYERNMKKLQEQRTKTNALNILKIFSENSDEKQIQLNCMIENMKQCVYILQKQANQGDEVSQRILDRFDPKLMKMFLLNPENNASQQDTEKKKLDDKIQSQLSNFTVNLFGKNQEN